MMRSLLLAAALQLVSVSSAEVQANGHSIGADISRDGRLVAFHSLATNLSRRARGSSPQHVYLRDRRRGTTRMVSMGSRGQTSNLADWQPSISPNGRFVAWCSTSTNLARPDAHSGVPWTGPGWDPRTDVFVRDLRRGITRRASDDRRGGMADNASCRPVAAAWRTTQAAGPTSPTTATSPSSRTPAISWPATRTATPTSSPTTGAPTASPA